MLRPLSLPPDGTQGSRWRKSKECETESLPKPPCLGAHRTFPSLTSAPQHSPYRKLRHTREAPTEHSNMTRCTPLAPQRQRCIWGLLPQPQPRCSSCRSCPGSKETDGDTGSLSRSSPGTHPSLRSSHRAALATGMLQGSVFWAQLLAVALRRPVQASRVSLKGVGLRVLTQVPQTCPQGSGPVGMVRR